MIEFLEGGDLLTQFENQGSQPYQEEREFFIHSNLEITNFLQKLQES